MGLKEFNEGLDLLEREGQAQKGLARSLSIAAEKNPDEEARRREISRRTGLPADWVPEFKDDASRRELLGSPAVRDLPRTAPGTAAFLSDPDNAAIAHDDIRTLSQVETAVLGLGKDPGTDRTARIGALKPLEDEGPGVMERLGTAYRSGQKQQVLGRLGWLLKEGDTTPGLREEASALDKEVAAAERQMEERAGTFVADYLQPAAQVLGQMVESGKFAVAKGSATGILMGSAGAMAGPAAPVTAPVAAAGGFAAGMTWGFFEDTMRVEGGSAYLELSKLRGTNGETLPEEEVRQAAAVVGIVNGALELGGMKVLAAPWKRLVQRGIQKAMLQEAQEALVRPTVARAAGTAAKAYAAGVAAETGQEILQETTNVLAEEVLKSRQPDGSFDPATLEEIGGRLYSIASRTARAMAVIGAVGPGVNLRADVQAARAATERERVFQAMAEASTGSKLRARLPEKFREFVDGVTAEGPAAEIYVPVEQWNTYWQSRNLDPEAVATEVLGEGGRYQEAVATGGDLVIPTGRYAEVLAGTEHHAGLARDLRFQPGEMTLREAEEFRMNLPAQLAELDAETQKAAPAEEAERKVYEDVRTLLESAGRTPEEAAAGAEVWRARYRTRAQRLGKDPWELYQEHPREIVGTEGGLQAGPAGELSQTAPVATIAGNELGEFGDDIGKLREAAVSWFRENLQRPNIRIRRPELDGEIRFSGKGRKKFRKNSANPSKLQMVVAVKDIIEKGDYAGRHPVNKPRADSIVAFHWFDGDVRLADTDHRARALVGEDENGNLFYDLYADVEEHDKVMRRGSNRRIEVRPDTAPEDGGTTLDQSIPPDDDGINLRILPQEEAGKQSRRGYIRFGPGGEIRIGLLKNADRSTFLHETGHAWLEELREDAAREDAPEQVKADWAMIAMHLGVAADGKIPAEAHEKFARTAEAYVMEGKAPSVELQGAFSRFRDWLLRIYREIRNLGVELTPEVREVFDRLVATDDEIAAARGEALQEPILDKETIEGHATPEEASRYRAVAEEAKAAATENLNRHRTDGREKRLEEWRRWAEDAVASDRLRQSIDALAEGPGIDRESVRRILGDEGMREVPEAEASGLWRTEGGLDVEHAAAQAGYHDARRFVEDVLEAGTREEAVQRLIESQEAGWEEQYGPQEAIRTPAAQTQMEIESRIIARAASEESRREAARKGRRFEPTPLSMLREWAAEKIRQEKLTDAIGVYRLLVASRKARRQALVAAKKKNWAAAFLANERARLTEELIYEHYKAQKEFRKMRDAWQRAIKTEISSEYRDQLNRLLMKFRLTTRQLPVSDEAPSLVKFFAEQGAGQEGDEIGVISAYSPAEWIVEGDPREISKMTWGEVQELHEALSWLVGRGREESKATIESGKKAVADAIAEALSESEGLKRIVPPKDTTVRHKARKAKEGYFAGLDKLPRQMKWMDGFKNVRKGGKAGANERLILNPIQHGLGEKYREQERLQKLLKPHLEQLEASAEKHPRDLTHAPLPALLERYNMPWTFERVVAVALNMGTQENRSRLETGYGLREGQMDQVVSILSEADWRAIEGIQEAIGTMFPKIAEVHAKINHFPLKKVRGMKFAVRAAEGKIIQVQGGYYPLRYDGEILRKIGQWGERDELLNRHQGVLQTPSAKKGFTEARRKNVVLPVKLSLSVLSEHVEDVTTYAHVALPVRDADRITRDAAYMERAEDVMGKEKADQIRPALKDILRRDGRRKDTAERVYAWSRKLTSLYYIGWNFWTAAQNLVNLFPVLMVGGRKVFADGMLDVYSRPREAYREILSKSAYMAQRAEALDREMVRGWSRFGKQREIKGVSLEDVREAGYALMKMTDTMYTLPMWQGAYNEGLRLYEGDEEQAILHADDRVRSVFGSGLTVDMARFQRDPGLMSLLTQFATFFMTQQQLVANSYQAMKAGQITKRQFLYDYAMVMIFPSIASTVLFSLLTKAELPEWEEIFGDLWSYSLGGLPGIRDIVPSAQAIFGKSRRPPAGVRIPAAEIGKDIQKLLTDAASLEGDKVAWDLARLASFFSGIPAARTYERWKKGSKQGLPQNVLIPARD